MTKLFVSIMFAAAANASFLQLTPENFAEKTDGKRVFLKFFAPWWVAGSGYYRSEMCF